MERKIQIVMTFLVAFLGFLFCLGKDEGQHNLGALLIGIAFGRSMGWNDNAK